MDELPVSRLVRLSVLALGLSACTVGVRRAPPVRAGASGTEQSRAFVAQATAAADRIAAASDDAPTAAWYRLAELVDDFGSRITGSPALDQALAWAATQMRTDGLDDVRLEPVKVSHWVRGRERATIVRPVTRELALLGLGGTVGTRASIRAPLAVFDDLDALRASTASLDGAIAFVNHRMPPFDDVHDDPGYLRGVQARLRAASEAAKRGARAVLIRSVTATSLRTPHAGALKYDDGVPKIPAAAVSIEDAELLARLARRGPVEVELSLGARTLPDAPSANVVGELRGRELPDEIVLLGAHMDSWDVGPGASDDGAGCVAVMEALRLLRQAGLTPRRTIRAVLFTGEEYGLSGAKAYHERHRSERHVAAFETDYGMAAPDAIGVGGEAGMAAMQPLLPAFGRFGIRRFRDHAFGADVEPIVGDGAAAFNLQPDGHHYFDIHHTAADTLDKIRPEDLRRNAAAIALLGWVLAER
ncbi:MAG: M20/M25/M40 family metallo-hydrolase [Deltaproteobacteria bacterium]|nr:MAG: M20/M25/M40 family metallo-hydrolase [Deltaproteobacteria bacterium]